MPRDVNGTYSLPTNDSSPAAPRNVIRSSDFNELTGDYATALSDSLSRSGKGKMQADLDMDGNDVLNAPNLDATAAIAASAWQPTTGTDSFGASINSSRIYGRVRDHVDILDYATSVSARDNIKNGSTGFKTVFDDAVTDAVARGIGFVHFPAGNFELDSGQVLNNPGLYVRGEAGATYLYKNGAGRMFQTLGTVPTIGYSLTADAAAGAVSITMSTSDAANFTAGTRAILWQNVATQSDSARDAEFVWITNVNTGTGVITFAAPIYFAYATANTAKLFNVSLVSGVGYENLIVDWTDGAQTSPQRPPYNVDEVFVPWFCHRPRFVNISTINTINATINFHGCVDAYVANLRGTNGKSDGTDLTDSYSYGIAESGLNVGLLANGLQFERHRHAYTTGGPDSADATMFNGGHPFYSVIANGTHRWAKESGWDVHAAGIGITFQNLHTLGGVTSGFQIRCRGLRLIDCHARDIQQSGGTLGHGLYIVGGDTGNLWAKDTQVINFSAYNVAGSGVRDQSTGTILRGLRVEKAQGNAISWDGSASGDGEYSDIYAKDVAKNSSLGGAYAVTLGNASVQKNPRIRDLFVDDPNNNLTALVRRNNFSTDRVEITNARGQNSSFAGIPVASSATNTSNIMIRDGYGPTGMSNGPTKTATIASNSIDVSAIYAGGVLLAGTGPLITVVGSDRESELRIWGPSSGTITLNHGSSTDNLVLKGAANQAIGNNQCITFERRGSVWIEVSRNF